MARTIRKAPKDGRHYFPSKRARASAKRSDRHAARQELQGWTR